MDQAGTETQLRTDLASQMEFHDQATRAGSHANSNVLRHDQNSGRSSNDRHLADTDKSLDHLLDHSNIALNSGDNVRFTSGQNMQRHDMPISIDTQCLSHQPSGADAQMTLKLFKLACLAYKPTDVHYRNMNVDRNTIIQLRRGLIDRISNLLPTCELFKESAIYPRRYFDDLMIEHGLQLRHLLETSSSVEKMNATGSHYNQ